MNLARAPRRLGPGLARLGLVGWLTTAMPGVASAVTVAKIVSNAQTYANHAWTSTAANTKASCYPGYVSPFMAKYGIGKHVGLPYDYADWTTIADFDAKIAQGYGAGSQTSFGVLSCTVGHDCSGFVSRVWEHPKRYTTTYMYQISKEIPSSTVATGDIFNYPGKHVVLYDSLAGNGTPRFYEAAGGVWKVWYATSKGWSYLNGYVSRRYNNLEGGAVVPPAQPTIIPVPAFPFSHQANTVTTGTAVFNDYGPACPPPSGGELGPEIIYALEIPSQGVLKVELSDGVGVDLDVHLLTSLDPKSCFARDDTTIGPVNVQPGKLYVVADTWSNASGQPKPGPYSIQMSFTSTCKPNVEVCNGVDDDCDGAVDEGALCDDGLPCTDDVCGPSGACEVEPNGAGCLIAGTCLASGATKPGTACLTCDPSQPTVWSPGNEGQLCDDAAFCSAASTCQAGACIATVALVCAAAAGPCQAATCDEAAKACTVKPLPAGTPCGEPTCGAGSAVAAGSCDGAGQCSAGAVTDCGAFGCSAAKQCSTGCDAAGGCAEGAHCVAGACVWPVAKPDGGTTATDSGAHDHASGDAAAMPDATTLAADGASETGLPTHRDASAAAVAPFAQPVAAHASCQAGTAGDGDGPMRLGSLIAAMAALSLRRRGRAQG